MQVGRRRFVDGQATLPYPPVGYSAPPNGAYSLKYLVLTWAGFWRNPVRTVLTFASIACAFLLFGSLHGIRAGFDEALQLVDARQLRTGSADGSRAMPIVYRTHIDQLPHVASTMIVTQIGGYYQQPANPLTVNAIGGDVDLKVFGPLRDAQRLGLALTKVRTGAIVGRKVADEFGWKVGDRIPVISGTARRDGSPSWDFDLIGIYDIPTAPERATRFIFNYDYLEEARATGQGVTNQLYVRTDSAAYTAQVARDIDALFATSDLPTDTQNEREYQRAAASAAYDMKLIVTSVGLASLFALLVVAVSTMAQSIRQRLSELALMKALGFDDLRVAAVVMIEAMLLCVPAALLGLFLATLFYPKIAIAVKAPYILMPVQVPLLGIALAFVVALASSIFPVWTLKRLSIVQGLAKRT
jgi:putative ABC transport system permease protein